MPRPHPTNTGEFRPTPRLTKAQRPSEGELQCYQNGVSRFPNLAHLGSFLSWPLVDLFPGVILTPACFNCFGWAVGHTDRWIEGDSVEIMNELFESYHFEQCHHSEASVELYRLVDAPVMLVNRRGQPYLNTKSHVKHAHRRDDPTFDRSPHLGCSSKLGPGSFIAHNRGGLEDTRPYGSGRPQITYGSIYQHWRRTPEHPIHPGKEGNLLRATGNYPDDPIFFNGPGKYPPGHPGNTIGLPGYGSSNNKRPDPTSDRSLSNLRSRMSEDHHSHKARLSSTSHKSMQATSSRGVPAYPSATSQSKHMTGASGSSSHGVASYSSTSQGSRQKYAKVPRMRAHDPIPRPSRAAEDSAVRAYKDILKIAPNLVKDFEVRFFAWQEIWRSPSMRLRSDARARCDVDEFDDLFKMGPRIIPLVIYKLLDSRNFTGVFLYNALESDLSYRIDPRDVLNFLVLQRQNNLIVDLNEGRRWRY